MGCNVYANGDEIACKAGDGKVIAAFPDVCLSPPSPPAGPIPVPYPDTSFSKDMQNGSKTVKIKGKEVMLKDQSFYKTSPLGDEAATKGLWGRRHHSRHHGQDVFVAWSMDVEFEDQNVDRHTDLTTSNHASPTANASGSEHEQRRGPRASNGRGRGLSRAALKPPTLTVPFSPRVKTTVPRTLSLRTQTGLSRSWTRTPTPRICSNRCATARATSPPHPNGGPCAIYHVTNTRKAKRSTTSGALAESSHLRSVAHSGSASKWASHRPSYPKECGGRPEKGQETLEPVSPECQETENRLGEHQGARIDALRPLWGRA